MKRIVGFFFVFLTIITIFFAVFGNSINIPSVLRSLGLNFAIANQSTGRCSQILAPGYYDISSSNIDNNINGVTIGDNATFKNQSSDYITSASTCYGDFTFEPTNIKDIDYLNKENFDIESGTYVVGINISPGKYNISAPLKNNEKLHMYTEFDRNGTTAGGVEEASSDEVLTLTLEEGDLVQLYVYKDNLLGTDEIVSKKINFEKL